MMKRIQLILLTLVLSAPFAFAQVYNYFPPPGITYTPAGGMALGTATGGVQGVGTINAQGVFINGVPAATGSSGGTVTDVSVFNANGFTASVTNPTTTPAILLATTFTGIGYSNGTGFAAAIASNFPTLNQNTTGNALTATTAAALTGTPSLCGGGQVAAGILANGNATGCVAVTSFGNQSANTAFMGPVSGSPAAPAFRILNANDIPATLNGGLDVSGLFKANGSVTAEGGGLYDTNVQSTLIGQTNSGGGFQVGIGLNGTFDGSNWRTGTDTASNGAAFITSTYNPGNLNFYTVPNTGGTSQSISNATLNSTNLRMRIGFAGNVTVFAPASGDAFVSNGVAANSAAFLQGSSTSGASYGLTIRAGSTNADYAERILDTTGATQFLDVIGDGAILVGNPTGGDEGAGTINAQGLFVNGVAVSAGGTVNSGTALQMAYYATTGTAVSGLATTGTGNAVLATSPTLTTPTFTSAVAGAPTGGNEGPGTLNATGLYINGTALAAITQSSGTFTGTLTGMTGSTTGTFNYVQTGNFVTIWSASGLTGTSTNDSMTLSGMPGGICWTAGGAAAVIGGGMENNGIANVSGFGIQGSSCILVLGRNLVSGSDIVQSITNWTVSGTKGVSPNWSATYPLN